MRQYQVQLFPTPRYKELSVKIVWGYAKEVEELNQYFPDYNKGELPERDYLWTVISSLMPKETKKLIENAREQRGVSKKNNNELIVLTNELKKEIFDVKVQKSKYYSYVIYSATKGNAVYMLKKAAVFEETKEKLSSVFGKFRNNKDSWKNTSKTEN